MSEIVEENESWTIIEFIGIKIRYTYYHIGSNVGNANASKKHVSHDHRCEDE